MQSICVFCGSRTGALPEYSGAAKILGQSLAELELRLIYGGGNIGLMGLLADSVLEAGGEVVGVIPQALAEKEVAHTGITQLHIVSSMHERKAMMADLSDGFIAMPGGYGTFEEFCEIITWYQLGIHRKACGLLNIAGYYDPLLAQFDLGVREEFISDNHRKMIIADTNPQALLQKILGFHSTEKTQWLAQDET